MFFGGNTMEHTAKDFTHLIGLPVFSEKQLRDHFKLYEGYVKKLNEIETKLKTADRSSPNYSYNEYSELKRRHVVPFNGTFLHELYFENLTKNTTQPSAALRKAGEEAFGTWENLIVDMKAAAGSTPGWVLLTWNKIEKKLETWIMFEHHIGMPAYQEIILALDCWEHAFFIDYGVDKPGYLKAFFEVVDWNVVEQRFKKTQ